VVHLELTECLLFSGEMLEGRANSANQSLQDDEEMEKPLQWSRIDATAQDGGRNRRNCQAAAAHQLGTSSFMGCSAETRLGGDRSSRFISFWRTRSI